MYTTLTQPKQRGKHPKRPHSTLPERQRARRRCASGSVCVAQCVCKGWRDHALCAGLTDGHQSQPYNREHSKQRPVINTGDHTRCTPRRAWVWSCDGPQTPPNGREKAAGKSVQTALTSQMELDCQGWGVGKSIFL